MKERDRYPKEDVNLIKLLEAIEEVKYELKKNKREESAKNNDQAGEPIEGFNHPHENGE
jgi:hypothetical protein